MKKILVVLVLIFMATAAYADDWYSTNQITVSWDAVTTLVTGVPIPSTNKIRYGVYIMDRKTGVYCEYIETLDNSTSVSVILDDDCEGFFYVGVKAFRYDSEDVLLAESDISWTSDGAVTASGQPWGIRHHIPPGKPNNIEPSNW